MADCSDFIGENVNETFGRDNLFGFGVDVFERVFEWLRLRFSEDGFDKGSDDPGDGREIDDVGVDVKNGFFEK